MRITLISLIILFLIGPFAIENVNAKKRKKRSFSTLEQVNVNNDKVKLIAKSLEVNSSEFPAFIPIVDLKIRAQRKVLHSEKENFFYVSTYQNLANGEKSWLGKSLIIKSKRKRQHNFTIKLNKFCERTQSYNFRILDSAGNILTIFTAEFTDLDFDSSKVNCNADINGIFTEEQMDYIFSHVEFNYSDSSQASVRKTKESKYQINLPAKTTLSNTLSRSANRAFLLKQNPSAKPEEIDHIIASNEQRKFAQIVGAQGPAGPAGAPGAAGAAGAAGNNGSGFIFDGNSENSNTSLGNTDNFSLAILTNNLERLFIAAGGNVGVGDSNPSNFLLEVNGNMGMSTTNSFDMGSATNRFRDLFIGSGGLHLGDAANDTFIQYDTGNNILGFDSNAAGSYEMTLTDNGELGIGEDSPEAILEVSASNVSRDYFKISSDDDNDGDILSVIANSNVGIGTDTPSTTFDLNGDLLISGGAPGNGKVLLSDATGLATWSALPAATGDFPSGGTAPGSDRTLGNDDNFALGFETNNTERVHIAANGDVGIATTTPSQLLDINGTLAIRGGSPIAGQILTSDASGLATWTALGSSGAGGDFTDGGNNFGGNATIGNDSNFSMDFITNNTSRIHVAANGNVGIHNTNPTVLFDVTGDVGNASTVSIDTGKVLIADGSAATPTMSFTNDPDMGIFRAGDDSLGVSVGGTTQFLVNSTGVSFPGTKDFTPRSVDTVGVTSAADGSEAEPSYTYIADDDTGIYRPGDDTLAFVTGGATAITITNAGDLGIGTTTPSRKLEVVGDTLVNTLQTTAGRFFNQDGTLALPSYTFSSDEDTGIFREGNDSIAISLGGTKVLDFETDGLHSSVEYRQAGDYNYSGKILNLDGSVSVPSYSFTTDTDTGFYRAADDEIRFTTGGTDRFTVKASGRIGVNTTNPSVLFDAIGNTFVSANYIVDQSLHAPDGSAGAPSYSFSADTDTGIYSGTNNELRFSTGGTDQVYILANGNVGLGVSNPSFKLSLDGEMKVTGVNTTGKVVCVKGDGTMGTCGTAPDVTGVCAVCN